MTNASSIVAMSQNQYSLAGMAARQQIETALADYAIGIDDRNAERWLAAFHDDAVFDVDFPPAVLEGHAAILKWAEEVWRFHTITHMTGNHRIDLVDESHAEGMGRGIGLFKLEGGEVMLASARLKDRYLKRGGDWRIAYRKVSITSSFHLEQTVDLILNGEAVVRPELV